MIVLFVQCLHYANAQTAYPVYVTMYYEQQDANLFNIHNYSIDCRYDDSLTNCNLLNNGLYGNISPDIKYKSRMKMELPAGCNRLLITHGKDTMLIDFPGYRDMGLQVDSITFKPGYFVYNFMLSPRYNRNYRKGMTKEEVWLKKYKVNNYKTFITPCIKK